VRVRSMTLAVAATPASSIDRDDIARLALPGLPVRSTKRLRRRGRAGRVDSGQIKAAATSRRRGCQRANCFHSVSYGYFAISMHHAGGSGGRKNALRCSRVRQRGMAASAADTSPRGIGKNLPNPRCVVLRCGDALAVGAERRARQFTFMAFGRLAIGLQLAASQTRAVLSSDAVLVNRGARAS
jgi:hypothetical protein